MLHHKCNTHISQLVSQIVKRAFGHLARFAAVHTEVFDCGPGSVQDRTSRRTAALQGARHELLEYAKLAEQVNDHRMSL